MAALSLPFTAYDTHPEDRRFKWIMVLSVVIHSIVLLEPKQTNLTSTTQAQHEGIDVSLVLLQQQVLKQQVTKSELSTAKHAPRQAEKEISNVTETHRVEPKAAPTKLLKESVSQPVQLVATAPKLDTHVTRGLTQEKLVTVDEHYLAKLLTHIESHKFYPRMAQRRGIEGAVTVSFRLLADGEVDDLNVSGAHMLLQKAAQAAVNQAMPMLPAPEEIRLPMQISFVMQFQLPGA